MTAPCISIIIPVYNEAGNIADCVRGLTRALGHLEHEVLVCYDFDADTTLPALDRMQDRPDTVKCVRNQLGRGAAAAIRSGFLAARGDVLVTTMADLSDPPEIIPAMARKIREEGADVVSGSRYMKGGSQSGGPRLKTLLSRAAGLSLRLLAGLGTHDATTNFRAYSRRLVEQIPVESQHGMELALELTVKAHLGGFRVDEVASTWKDRSSGESRFRLWTWLPRYLRWYLQAVGDPLFVWAVWLAASVAALGVAAVHAPVLPHWDDWAFVGVLTGREPLSLNWLFSQHFEHRIPLAKLVWLAVERLSGGNARALTLLIAGLLSASSALLLRGLLGFRGRLLWTDAFVPLLYLHWDHWENLTWPFQIAFGLHTVAVAFIVSRVLRLGRSDPGSGGLPLDVGLLVLPWCGSTSLPFVLLLAPWRLWVLRRQGSGRARAASRGILVAALVTAAALALSQRLLPGMPRAPLGTSLEVAWEFLTGSLGIEGNRNWPRSGWATLAALVPTLGILLYRSRPREPGRRVAQGLLLALAGVLALGAAIGQARGTLSPLAGFFDRYVTLSCLFAFLVYASAEFYRPRILGRIAQMTLAVLMMFLFVTNARHAWDLLGQRRLANDRMRRDIEAGMPVPVLARLHSGWHMGSVEEFEEDLSRLAEARLALYRSHPPLHLLPAPAVSSLRLPDGRQVAVLRPGTRVRLDSGGGSGQVRITYGIFGPPAEDLRLQIRWIPSSGLPRLLWQGPACPPGSADLRLPEGSPGQVEVELGASSQTPAGRDGRGWVVLEAIPRVP